MITNLREVTFVSTWRGKRIQIEIFGSSHSKEIGTVLKNYPSESFDKDKLQKFLNRRKPTYSPIFTARKESDVPVFSGLKEGEILSKTVKAVIKNEDVKKSDYADLYAIPRPSHADLSAYYRFGRLDFSGGGEFSGRMTAPLCVAGGIAKQLLEKRGVFVHAYLSKAGNVKAKSFKTDSVTPSDFVDYEERPFPSLNNESELICEIEKAKAEGDSVGGIIECVVFGMKKGVGDSLFGGMEGKISTLIYAIPAVKGVSFGGGFSLAEKRGSEANDQIYVENGEIFTKTNNSGGINGGITDGMPITISVAVKPTPSIEKEQNSVSLLTKENVKIKIKGRHDACVAVRAVPAVESAVSIALLDELCQK